MSAPRPRPWVGAPPYRVPRAQAPVDLRLDANEGARPDPTLLDEIQDRARVLGDYPSAASLERALAAWLGVAPERVLVTAGADDAIDRSCRAMLGPGLRATLPEPGFVMLRRYVELTGAQVDAVPWPEGPYPTEGVIEAHTPQTRLVSLTSPNNPTGAVVTPSDLKRVGRACEGALLLVDLAYAEFADHDLTPDALRLENALITRTFSKAWGLAGLRIGYAVGPAQVIGWLRGIGLPYAASGLSLALAERALTDPDRMIDFVSRVRRGRGQLVDALRRAGARPQTSQANFVLARVEDPLWWRDGMAGLGIGIRAFPGVEGLVDAIRIAVPGEAASLERLCRAVATVACPQRLVHAAPGDWLGDRYDALPEALCSRQPTWALVQTPEEVAQARQARALPLAIGPRAGALVPLGAARAVDLASLRALLPPSLRAR
ncbi:MAG: histidinol-phosphate aminotransferase family protein [Deltaproteobacteria bacterium]|nr:MAG: histidinol-phosphate aminotransferase family protein [Deltaproteobacteria bacterium]